MSSQVSSHSQACSNCSNRVTESDNNKISSAYKIILQSLVTWKISTMQININQQKKQSRAMLLGNRVIIVSSSVL